jgi:hypothetical protein
MCLLWDTNWVFISQKTTFFIVTAVETSNLTQLGLCFLHLSLLLCNPPNWMWLCRQTTMTFPWCIVRHTPPYRKPTALVSRCSALHLRPYDVGLTCIGDGLFEKPAGVVWCNNNADNVSGHEGLRVLLPWQLTVQNWRFECSVCKMGSH